jgi:hypothetical protein
MDNSWMPSWIFSNKNPQHISTIEGNKPLNCIFEIIKQQKSKYRTGFYYDWDWLEYFGNKYMGGQYIDDEYSCREGDFAVCDEIIKKRFSEKIKIISPGSEQDFEFFFLYLGAIDFRGHTKGWCGVEYMKTIETVDSYIRDVLNTFEKKGLLENTQVLLTSDHGASVGAFNHGEQNDDNLFVPFFAMGPGIRKNYEIVGNVHLLDIAPTVMKMMRLKKYPKWRGKVVVEIFENIDEGFLEKCDEGMEK